MEKAMESDMPHIVKPSQKFSPYTKPERQKRRQEVFRLHVELGYPATKISEILQVNRNTVNQDIEWCYQQIGEIDLDLDTIITRQLVRLDMQRTRIYEQLFKTENFAERHSLEKLIFEIDSQIASLMVKINNYQRDAVKIAVNKVNGYLDEKKLYNIPRFSCGYDIVSTSPQTQAKIRELINNDRRPSPTGRQGS
jgi:predicted DNA-binding protein YlxM (UPF0122 family)